MLYTNRKFPDEGWLIQYKPMRGNPILFLLCYILLLNTKGWQELEPIWYCPRSQQYHHEEYIPAWRVFHTIKYNKMVKVYTLTVHRKLFHCERPKTWRIAAIGVVPIAVFAANFTGENCFRFCKKFQKLYCTIHCILYYSTTSISAMQHLSVTAKQLKGQGHRIVEPCFLWSKHDTNAKLL